MTCGAQVVEAYRLQSLDVWNHLGSDADTWDERLDDVVIRAAAALVVYPGDEDIGALPKSHLSVEMLRGKG